jgi:hypothetical protein|tara:strand:+ start:17363 stop:17626 length:264 start_codon:yes stop_codon:yes gene_type:complete
MGTDHGNVTFSDSGEIHKFESLDMLMLVLENLDEEGEHSGSISFTKDENIHPCADSSMIVFGRVTKDNLIKLVDSIKNKKLERNYIV